MPLARGTALPGAEEAADDGRVCGGPEVGVVEHHQRSVPAHLEQQPLARGARCDPQTGRGRTDEADGGHVGMPDEFVADDRTRAGHEVEGARRQVGLCDAVGQQRRAVGGRRRRCPHDRVANGERRGHDLRGHRVWPVPWCHHGHRSDRTAQHEHPLAR